MHQHLQHHLTLFQYHSFDNYNIALVLILLFILYQSLFYCYYHYDFINIGFIVFLLDFLCLNIFLRFVLSIFNSIAKFKFRSFRIYSASLAKAASICFSNNQHQYVFHQQNDEKCYFTHLITCLNNQDKRYYYALLCVLKILPFNVLLSHKLAFLVSRINYIIIG